MNKQSKYINLRGVIDLTSLSRSVIYRLIADCDFPKPFSIKGVEKRKVWSVEEIDQWLDKNTLKTE